jgi:AraC-like DNA-binding protein
MSEQFTSYEHNIDFPRGIPFRAGYNRNYTAPRQVHTHNGIEIGAIISGRGTMYMAGRSYDIKAGDLTFVDAAIPHWHFTRRNSSMEQIWVVIPLQSTLNLAPTRGDMRLFQPFVGLRWGISPVLSNRKRSIACIKEFFRLYTSRPRDWDLTAWALLADVLAEIARAVLPIIRKQADKKALHNIRAIMNAIQYLNSHFKEPVTIDALSSMCNLSRSRFSHLFSQIMGISPIHYRNQMRISYAIDRLISTNDSLEKIAADSGFQSISLFRNIFAKTAKSSSRAFRAARI